MIKRVKRAAGEALVREGKPGRGHACSRGRRTRGGGSPSLRPLLLRVVKSQL